MEESTGEIQIPDELLRAGASGRLCVVLGPHLVVGSGFPTPEEIWRTVFSRALQECALARREELEEARDIFTEPGNHRDKYALLSSILTEAFVDGSIIGALRGIQTKPTPLHHTIAALPALYLTTLPDELLQRARLGKNVSCLTGFLDDGDDRPTPAVGDVLALGGTAIKSGIIPFARPSLPLTDKQQSRLQKTLNRISTILLLGFEAHDDELQSVLHLLKEAQLDPHPRRYWLASRDPRIRARAAAYRIEPLWLTSEQNAESFCRTLIQRIADQNADRTSLWPLPENTPEEIRTALAEGHRALAIADLGLATEHGLKICDLADPKNQPQLLLEGLAILYFALRRTLFEEPPDAALIPVERRGQVLEVLEKGLAGLRDVKRWGPLAFDLAKVIASWTLDETTLLSRFANASANVPQIGDNNLSISDSNDPGRIEDSDKDDEGNEPTNELELAIKLAEAGKVEEALAKVPPSNHRWLGEFRRAFVLSKSQQTERALVTTLALCRQFPGRAFIEELTASILNRAGRVEEALVHAQRAFREFPSRGNRHLLGSMFARLGRPIEAWGVLEPLQDTKDVDILRLLNRVAREVEQLTATSSRADGPNAPQADESEGTQLSPSPRLSENDKRAFFYFYENYGSPSFESLCAECDASYTSAFEKLAKDVAHRVLPGLSLAIEHAKKPEIQIANRRIIVGPLELCLISYLDLWQSLRLALGSQGKLVVFDDVARRISSKISETATSHDLKLKEDFDSAMSTGMIQIAKRPIPENGPVRIEHFVDNAYASVDITQDLAYYLALLDEPELFYLCADAFCYSDEGVKHEAEALRRDVTPEGKTGATQLREQVITMPLLVRSILAGGQAVSSDKLLSLAELGFADAIDPEQILALNQRNGTIDREVPLRILERIERFVRHREHLSQHNATMILARHYSGAIWDASCGNNGYSESDARVLTASLLQRCDELDEVFKTAIMKRIFEHLAQLSIIGRVSSTLNEPRQLPDLSITKSLWVFLAGWAGQHGRRRSAMNIGLRRVWLQIDDDTEGDGNSREGIEPLLVATFGRQSIPLTLTGAAASAAILTSTWTTQVLEQIDVNVESDRIGKSEPMRLGRLLAQAADLLDAGLVKMTETSCIAHILAGEMSHEAQITVPPEAVLLRASPSTRIDAARVLARLQGPYDGRAYERLTALAMKPDDTNLLKRCAREAILAPYLLVREDPTIVLRWNIYLTQGLPENLSELCSMLSEPIHDEPERTLRQELDIRMEAGAWQDRSDKHQLLNQAAQIPGSTSQYGMNFELNASNASLRVANALHILDHANEYSAGKISSTILFLRLIAERVQHVSLPQGDVDLRERLPERLINLLDVIEKPPQQGTLAAYEAGLLRLCSVQVKRLDAESSLSPRHHLWLTYRLFQWIVAQLDTLTPTAKLAAFEVLATGLPGPAVEQASDDLLDPAGFDSKDGIDYRLVTVLYALSQMNIVAKESNEGEEQSESTVKPWRFSSAMLEKRYAQLAARPLTKRELRLRPRGMTPTSFDWEAPGTIPDLALLALVTSRREGFVRIASEARLRWIRDLPTGPNDTTRMPWVVAGALHPAISASLPDLGSEETKAFEEKLRVLEGDSVVSSWRWLGLTALYRAGQGNVTEEEVLELLLGHLDVKAAPKVFGWALLGVARKNPDGLETFVTRVLDTAMERKLDPVPLAEGVTFVLALGKNRASITKAKEILLALNARAPFQGDERMKKLVAQFGLR